MILDLNAYPSTKDAVVTLRTKLHEIADYMQKAGRLPTRLHVFAKDYDAAVRSVNAEQRRHARAKAREEERVLRSCGKKGDAAKVPTNPDLVEGVVFGEIPVEPVSYSRPRPVSA